MEPLPSLSGVLGVSRTHERAAGGSRKDAEAFRRALDQETSEKPGDDVPADRQSPLRTQLQPKPAADRRTDRAMTRHVDVIA